MHSGHDPFPSARQLPEYGGSGLIAIALVGLFIFTQGRANEWGVITAASLVGALPIVIFFFITQRQLVSGLAAGAVKG